MSEADGFILRTPRTSPGASLLVERRRPSATPPPRQSGIKSGRLGARSGDDDRPRIPCQTHGSK